MPPPRSVAALLACALLIVGLAGCTRGRQGAPTATTTPPRSGGTLRLALLAPASLDPARATSDSQRIIADSLFDGLTRLDPDGTPVPAVARSWSADPDQRRFTFSLRTDSRFSTGEPVRAADFVAGFKRVAASPDPAARALLAEVDGAAGVTAPAGDTLVVQLNAPDAGFPAAVADPALAPVPPAATGTGPAAKAWAARPTGNGPFALAGRPSPDRLALGRNPAFAGRPAWLDRVEVSTVPDAQTAWLAYQEGEVEYAPVPLDQLAAARQLFGTSADERLGPGLIEGPAAAIDVLVLPAGGPLAVPERRLAVAQAIDRDKLASAVAGAAVPADGLVPDGVRRAGPVGCLACKPDKAAAAPVLGAAGVPRLRVVAGDQADPVERALAARAAADLRAAGAKVIAAGGAAGGASVATLTVRTLAATSATSDAAAFMTALVALPGEASGEVGQLLGEAAGTAADDARLELARQAEAEAAADVLVVPLLERRQTAVLGPGVQGLDLTPLGLIDLAQVSLSG